jgi:hypothetical protein
MERGWDDWETAWSAGLEVRLGVGLGVGIGCGYHVTKQELDSDRSITHLPRLSLRVALPRDISRLSIGKQLIPRSSGRDGDSVLCGRGISDE